MIRTLLASGLLATSTVLAAAQNTGPQPVPGAMPDSDDIPSTMSAKNAHDDVLPVAAFRLKHLTDAQRQAIYQSVLATAKSDAAPLAAPGVDVGMVLSRNARLDPLPPEAAAVTPEGPRHPGQFRMAGLGPQIDQALLEGGVGAVARVAPHLAVGLLRLFV